MENKNLANQGLGLTESTLKYIPGYVLSQKCFVSLFHEAWLDFHVPDRTQEDPQHLRRLKMQFFSPRSWDLAASCCGMSMTGSHLPHLGPAKGSPSEPQEPGEVPRFQQGNERRPHTTQGDPQHLGRIKIQLLLPEKLGSGSL